MAEQDELKLEETTPNPPVAAAPVAAPPVAALKPPAPAPPVAAPAPKVEAKVEPPKVESPKVEPPVAPKVEVLKVEAQVEPPKPAPVMALHVPADLGPEYGVEDDRLSEIELVDLERRQASEDAAVRLSSTSFEIGSVEDPYLGAGVYGSHVAAVQAAEEARRAHGHR